ncbi:10905_t:CDS:10 [Funneliformis caledonium]|uniref:Pre-rRNA-processing protein RIX1 n=1 Tax=Funneliformis caledonium TaxID=1117310 RepID=A0A9N9C885_9GLOM|nr:10905_t:CDS:10 [Funneliformis caledonium]
MNNIESSKLLTTLITNYALDDNTVDTNVPFILEAITQYQLLSNVEEQMVLHKWCTRVNSLLHSKVMKARWAGICFIKISFEQSEEIFLQNLQSWTTTLMILLTKPEPTLVLKEIITTLTELFNKTQNKPELQREITTQQLPRFNTFLIKLSGLNKRLLPTIFSALSLSVKNFPSIFRPVNEPSQKLCLSILLDGTHDYESELSKMAVKCFSYIINFGGKMNNNTHYWKLNLLKVVGSLNNILDKLFDTIDEEKDASKKLAGFEMPQASENYIIAFPMLFSKFHCLSECLISLISLPTSLPVQFPVNQVTESKDKHEYYVLLLGIPSLFMHCNKILCAVVLSVGEHLIIHLRVISSILLKLLNNSKSSWLLRVSTYNLIDLCIQKYGISLTNLISSTLLSFIIDDIKIIQKSPYDISISVETTDHTNNKQKKSGKKKSSSSQITNSDVFVNSSGLTCSQTNVDVQYASLEVLKSLLKTCGSSMPSNTKSSLDNILLLRILSQNNKNSSNNSEDNVNMKLYECLLHSVISPSEYQPTQSYTETESEKEDKEDDNNKMMVIDQSPQISFDIVTTETSSNIVESMINKLNVDVDKNANKNFFDDNSILEVVNKSDNMLIGNRSNRINIHEQSTSSEMIENQKKRMRSLSPVDIEKEIAKGHDNVFKSFRMFKDDSDDDMEIPEIIMEGPDSEFEDNE